MKEALNETSYCDHGHSEIQAGAARLKANEKDPVKIASRSFYFVRDSVSFGFDLFQSKASDTLRRGYGACWNKSLLLTALLRCNQIPAHFGSIPLRRNFIRPVIGYWYWLANNPYNHCLVHAYLNHRWTKLDAVLDKNTYDEFFIPLPVEWGIDWNGKDDVCLYSESILGSSVIHTDIDATIDKKVGNTELPKSLASIGNMIVNRQIWKRTGFHASF
ncbi:MAG: transglutaminase-like domain-containing protein [Pseudomonadota bacterium]